MLMNCLCGDRVQKLTGHSRRPDVALVFKLFVRRHRYGTFRKQYANPAGQETTTIKLSGAARGHINDLLNVGNNNNGSTKRCEKDLKDWTLEFCSFGGKPSETLSGVLRVLNKIESISEKFPFRSFGIRDSWKRFW